MLDDILENLSTALGRGIKGRSTDARQDAFHRDLKEREAPDARQWLIHFPDTSYPMAREYSGTVPIALVGHKDLSDKEFVDEMSMIHHAVYPKQAVEPVFMTQPETMLDLRDFVRGGRYYNAARNYCGETVKLFEKIDALVDNMIIHPMSHSELRPYLESRKVFEIAPLIDKFYEISKGLVEPRNKERTIGDTANELSHPSGTANNY